MELKIFITKQKHLKRWEHGWFRSWYRIRLGQLVFEARRISSEIEKTPVTIVEFGKEDIEGVSQ